MALAGSMVYSNAAEPTLLDPPMDAYGRTVNSLRIQLNAVCNFSCIFCHMEGTGINSNEMTPAEIERIVEIAAANGVTRVKFTGGEPLLRRDIIEIISRTRKHVRGDLSLTTNGVQLSKLAFDLKKAGLDRVNISLHSTDPSGFAQITGMNAMDRVIEGLAAAKEAGLNPIKLNFVALNGVNVHQIPEMMEMCANEGVTLQIIELEATKTGEKTEFFRKYHYDILPLEREIAGKATGREKNMLHGRYRYTVDHLGKPLIVEFVRPMHNADFCMSCTRLRVTSTGKLKTCLMRNDNQTDVLPILRGDNDTGSLTGAYRSAVGRREPYWRREDET